MGRESVHEVLIVDDDELALTMLKMFVSKSPRLGVAGVVRSGEAAVEFVRSRRPDVVLMDMRMPGMGGVAAIREIDKVVPGCRILAVSSIATDEYVAEALRCGASGYLIKDTPPEQMLREIERVATGGSALSPQVVGHVVSAIQHGDPLPAARARVNLSQRELAVLELLAHGRSNREIANELRLTEATVKAHVMRITAKLGVRDRTQAVIRAHEWNLVSLTLSDDA